MSSTYCMKSHHAFVSPWLLWPCFKFTDLHTAEMLLAWKSQKIKVKKTGWCGNKNCGCVRKNCCRIICPYYQTNLITPSSVLFNHAVKKALIFISLWSSFVWIEKLKSCQSDSFVKWVFLKPKWELRIWYMCLTVSLLLTYREWEECKLMSKIITLRLSAAPIPTDVCAVSNCCATHSCGKSSRASTEEEDQVSKSM